MTKYCVFLVILGGLVVGCGPAPGYGPDGRMYPTTPASAPPGPGYYGGNTGAGSGGYAQPNQPPYGGYGYGPQTQAPPAYSGSGADAPPAADPSAYGASAEPIAPDPSGAPPAAVCDDSCRFANNGECDDGRDGSDTDLCAAGTDCTDCASAPR